MKLSKEELRHMLANVLDVDVAEVTDTAEFVEDLGVDSLMALEVLVALEKQDQIKLDEAKLIEMRSLDSVYSLLSEMGLVNDA